MVEEKKIKFPTTETYDFPNLILGDKGKYVDKYGNHYWHYGYTSETNRVSMQRCNIRGATVGGNSGCPVFLVVDDKLVLFFSKHLGYQGVETWSPFWGPSPSFRLDAIQNKINEWEGGNASLYQIVPFDLSSFEGITNQ